MGCPGEDGALGGCGRRLNELRGTLALSLTEKHILQPAPHAKPRSAPCAFPSRCGAREVWGNPPARLRGTMENASTGQMRSSNPPPGCGAACARVRRSRFESGLTERRTLPNRWVQNAPFRDAAAPGRCGATPRQAAGHYGEWLNWANALEQPPARLRGGLRGGPQISVRSLASRKGALCPTGGLQNALFRHDATAECVFP